MVVRETVRLTVHATLAIRAVLTSVAVLGTVRHILIFVSASVIVDWAVSTVLLTHVRSIVRVRVVWISITVSMSTLVRHVVRGRSLSDTGKSRVGGGVAAVWSFNVTIAGGGLGGGNLRLGFSARDTKPSSALRKGRILRLTVGVVVVVWKALVASIKRRIFATGGDSRLNGGLVCKRFLDLRLWLSKWLSERVIGFLRVVASEV